MKKMKAMALMALLIFSPPLLAAGSGGFPSRPNFQKVTINQTSINDVALKINAVDETIGLRISSLSGEQFYWSVGSWYDFPNWKAEASTSAIISSIAGVTSLCNNLGLTVGNTFTPSCWLSISGTGALSSTKACAAGYTRVGPNYCAKTTVYSFTSLTRDTCAALTTPSAGAKALIVLGVATVQTANSITARQTNLAYYGDATCTTAQGNIFVKAWEFVATTAGNPIGSGSGEFKIVNPAANTYSLKFTDDAGDQGAAQYEIRGYLD